MSGFADMQSRNDLLKLFSQAMRIGDANRTLDILRIRKLDRDRQDAAIVALMLPEVKKAVGI